MHKRWFLSLLLAALLCAPSVNVFAAEGISGSTYCFSPEDFSSDELAGICITGISDHRGTLLLGDRILRPGDVLTVRQVECMTFSSPQLWEDSAVEVSYLPIYENRVENETTMTLSLRGKENKAPIAEDFAAETYKNLPLEGSLKVTDPEGEAMVYTLIRAPRRGEVRLLEDGSFVYTPKKNNVGVDSFTFTAADSAGNVSRQATVTVTILKPADAILYTDTLGTKCRFSAEWMKNTGIFVGESVDGNACFQPEKEVTRGQFLAMTIRALDIPVDPEATFTGVTDQVPQWLKPYVAAALRSGLTASLGWSETFGAEMPITGAEAAVILNNALDLPVSTMGDDADRSAMSLQALAENGIALEADRILTREDASLILYEVSRIPAPGLAVFQKSEY